MLAIRRRSPGAFAFVMIAVLTASVTIGYSSALRREAPVPGGFIESADDTAVRLAPTASQIVAFLPATRGAFSFPSPYNTQAYRLTTTDDCAGTDCVQPGRPYWQALNNSTGSDTLYAVVSLAQHGGPTLFSVNKTSGVVSNLGPLFTSGPLAGDATPGYYFSATAATMLYVPQPQTLSRYDVATQALTSVFDIGSEAGIAAFGTDRTAAHYLTSGNGLVHTFSVKDADGAQLGCGVYRESPGEFRFIPKTGTFWECAPDKSGRYILVAEGTDLRSIDLETDQLQTLSELPAGRRAFDAGYGYVIAEDWGGAGHARMRRYFLDQPFTAPGQGELLSFLSDGGEDATRPSHTNAVAAAPGSQYACQATLLAADDPANPPREGELLCYQLDGSKRTLVVAPSMVQVGGAGGAGDDDQLPRGSLDPTGEFMIWTSNLMGSGRLDALIVRIPAHRLTSEADTTPPTVSVTAPANTSSVSGTVMIQANASDDDAIVGVQFTLDGVNLGTQVVAPPYNLSWDTTSGGDGVRSIRAVAYDAAGNQTTSSATLVTVVNTAASPAITDVTVIPQGDTTAIVTWLTTQLADSQIHYGITAAYTQATTIDSALVGLHGQLLTGLTPGTTYHYRVTSRTALGESVSSADLTFMAPSTFRPELPRTLIDTHYQLPTGGTTINVGPGDSLQDAIDAANPGDVIVLDATATFTGGFELRNKPGTGWIYIVSSAYASLPPPGTRVTPSDSVSMPKIVSPGTEAVFTTDRGAHHYRFVGIEIATTYASTDDTNFALVELGKFDQDSADDIPHDFTFDRCYFHGTETGNLRRGIAMSSASTAIIDSYMNEIHDAAADSQALASWNGPGPFKIVNNYLSAAGENVMFGGAEPSIPFLIPSDIEIRGNHITKPLTWKKDDPSYAGIDWIVKNLLEFKNAQRALVEGNVLENSWADDQIGIAVLFTGRNEEGTAPWSGVHDITFRRNIVRHVAGGFNFAGTDSVHSSQRTTRIQVRDNLIEDVTAALGLGRAFSMTITAPDPQPLVGVNHLTIEHNTVFSDDAYGYTDSGDIITQAQDNFSFRNNIVVRGPLGFGGTGTADGRTTLEAYYIAPIFVANAIIGASASSYLGYPGNFFPASVTDARFVNAAAGNYALDTTSPFRNAGTDGLDLGANISTLSAATASALSGVSIGDAPVISDVAASGITGDAATITWHTDIPADSQVEYGTTIQYGSASPADLDPITAHSIQLTGLAPGTTYHFRVHSSNAASWTGSSSDLTFTTVAPPSISAVLASEITATTAAITWTTDQASTSRVEYGVTTDYSNATTLDSSLITSHGQALTGLSLGTLYHYRVVSTNSFGLTAASADATFATIGMPVVSGVSASGITGTSATIAWTTDQSATSLVEYGLTTAYGSATTLNVALTTSHSQPLSGLTAGTTYHYRVISTNLGLLTTTSEDFSFATVAPPVISGVAASGITGSVATIAWTTDQASTSQIEYGPTTDYGTTTALDASTVTSHSRQLTGLNHGTVYHYRVISTNGVGLTTTSDDFTFTTVAKAVISAVASSGITTTSVTITWTTDQAASSQIEYDQDTTYGQQTAVDPLAVTAHSQTITGLSPGVTYHYRVRSRNAVGLVTISADFTVTTLAPPVISNVGALAVTGTAATIVWATERASSSQVEYGLTTSYGATTTLDATLVTSHSQNLSGLENGLTYHYRVSSTNSVGLNETSGDETFTTVAMPIISLVAVSPITGTSATITWTTDQPATSHVDYGSTTAYGNGTAVDPSLVTDHAQVVTGLTPGQTYHFRVRSSNSVDLLASSADATFTTIATPALSAVAVSAITGSAAAISWTTDQSASSQIEYGLTTAYGATTTRDSALVTSHNQSLTSLATGTTYHYRVISTNSVELSVTSDDATFTTVATPAISSVAASNITGVAATIIWTTDQATTSQVDYGPTTDYGTTTTLDAALVTAHNQLLSGLTLGTTYHYRVTSTNSVGLTITSPDATFTTVATPAVSSVAASNITGVAATITWTTDQATNSRVDYGLTTDYGATTTLDAALVTTHSAGLSGLTIGTTYHYRVTSTNFVGLTVTSPDATFTTVATPAISSVAASNITGVVATITWTTDQATSSQVEYGSTTDYGATTTLDATLVTSHSRQLTGLAIGATYHYRVTSTNSVGLSVTSPDATFTTVAAPTISVVTSSAITGTAATITWTTDQAASSQVDYGATTAYGATTTFDAALVTTHSQSVTALSPGTTYHYRVTSTNSVGLTVTSADATFTTVATPTISAVTSSAITGTTATITWTTDQAASTRVEYGTTTAYGPATFDAALVTSHSQILTGLAIGTTYHYRVISINGVELGVTSDDATFTTVAMPAISSVAASSITGVAATITWTTNQAASSHVEYGTTTAYGSATTLDTALTTSHSQGLIGLTPGTTYHYRVASENSVGLVSYSNDESFATIAPPAISSVTALGSTATSVVISWITNQPADSRVEYGTTTAYGTVTTLSSALTTAHVRTLQTLTPGVTYHFRVLSTNAVGLTTASPDDFFAMVAQPTASSIVVSSITGSAATISWVTDQPTDTQIEYGTTTAYGSSSTLDTTPATSHGQSLSGLLPGTTYHYRVRSTNEVGLTAAVEDGTFTTVAIPIISTTSVSAITGTTATVSWTTDQSTNSRIEYGPTTAYGAMTTLDATLVTSHSQNLAGLTIGTTYHYRVTSTNSVGLTVTSPNATFTTVATPTVSAVTASAITGTAATIAWTTDQATSTQVEYGTTTAYGTTTTLDATLVTSHTQDLTGLTIGTTYHYRVTSTNSVGLSVTSADATFTTVATPTIFAVTSSAITGTTATITWTTDQATSTQVEYGTTTAYGTTTTLDATLVTPHTQGLTGLTIGTTYHYRVTSTNSVGLSVTSADATFTTVATPTIFAVTSSAITGTTATIAWTTDQATSTQVEYGTTTAYGTTTTLDATLVTSHSQGLTGLTIGTTYHYRVASTNNVGLSVTSPDATFTTVATPTISAVTSSAITGTTATIAWTTDQATSTQVEYGTTTAYGTTTTLDATLVTSHSQNLAGLTIGTTYHYRVISANSVGLTVTSPDATFTTVATPTISAVTSSAITGTAATIAWTTDQATSTQVEYGTTTAYGTTTTLDAALVTSHSQGLTGLTIGTTYHYRVTSTNSAGLSVTSADATFTTVATPTVSALTASAITGTAATIAWTTDQATSTQVEYGTTTAYGTTTTLDATLVTPHTQGLTGLTIGTTYHYRVTSANSVGLTVTSPDATFTTVAAPTVSAVTTASVTGTTATITWTTDQSTTSQIEFGPTTAYGATNTLDTTLVTSHGQTLSGLAIGATYHYRVTSTNSVGLSVTSSDAIFTTISAPVISGVVAVNVTPASASIVWNTNQAADSQVEYGTTSAYGSLTTLLPVATTTHAAVIGGLAHGTTYHYRVRSMNTVGLLTVSADAVFTTVGTPEISGVATSSITRTSATVVWTTSQPADSWIEYGLTANYGGATALDVTLGTSHAVGFSGLSASTTYHYRVTSRNVFGLSSTSGDATFTTQAAPTDSTVTLSIVKIGTGIGTVTGPAGVNCGTNCSSEIPSGAPVTLTALSHAGSLFAGWSGACSGIQPSCTIVATSATSVTASFAGATPGDFDGDGYADLVWQHTDGTLALWTMQGSELLSSSFITTRARTTGGVSGAVGGVGLTTDSRIVDLNWQIVATPDLDGNGKADLLWQNTVTGELTAWIMEGAVKIRTEAITPGAIDPSWHLQAAADLNGDGSADLVWHHGVTHALDVWFMSGTTRIGEIAPQPEGVPAGWRLVGSADFDRDGQLDLLWQSQTTGDTYIWYMSGTALRLEQAIGRFGDGWQARAVADFDRDGHPDIVWQKPSGELAAWFLNGSTILRAVALNPSSVNPAWTIVGAR